MLHNTSTPHNNPEKSLIAYFLQTCCIHGYSDVIAVMFYCMFSHCTILTLKTTALPCVLDPLRNLISSLAYALTFQQVLLTLGQ